ncbi:MAG TPA: hypothetical protein VKL21_10880 [Candidatus Methanoperedens sp.]|nr:hypothetical protein [Candidatus Methanoperedens sp.]
MAGYAGLFQALIVQKKCRDILPKGNYPAGLVLFSRRSRKRRRSNIFICINLWIIGKINTWDGI